jgi:hypothetical protein
MIRNLHELDMRLQNVVEIHICGASAAILRNALKRASGDIDVISSSIPLRDPSVRKVLDEIDEAPNDKESWLNDTSKETILGCLPKSFKFDKEQIEGEKFDKLRPVLISKADFVICKLAIGKDALRPRDIPDVKTVELNKGDVERFFNKLNNISHENPALALRIEGLFKQIRPEFVVTDQGYAYTNEKEIAAYVKNRYGVNVSKDTIELWQEDITNFVKKPSSIVGYVDYKMGEEIDAGNAVLKSKDAMYRKQKEKDYGLDL